MAPAKLEVVTLSTATSTSSVTASTRSNSIDSSKTRASTLNVFQSLAKRSYAVGRQLAKVPSRSVLKMSGAKPPNMAEMRQVTPIYDHDLKRWVFPDVQVHKDEPIRGSACKQFPAAAVGANKGR